VVIRVPCGEGMAEMFPRLRGVLDGHAGGATVYFDLESDGLVLRCQPSNGMGVAPSEELAGQVEELLGAHTVRFGIEPSPRQGRPDARMRRGAG